MTKPTVPRVPTGFRVFDASVINDVILTLSWDQPQGRGSEIVVDHYELNITPMPLSHPVFITVPSPPLFVIVNSSSSYVVHISAVNCAGKSEQFISSPIRYCKFMAVD